MIERSYLLATNVKDERNVLEWVRHHLKKGFDHILIADDQSTIFKPAEMLVSLERWEKDRITIIVLHDSKHGYMQRALRFARMKRIGFMLYLDMDEYLYIDPVHYTISNFISFISDTDHELQNVGFPWVYFGSNFHNDLPHESQILPFYTRCSQYADHHVKHLVNVREVLYPCSPHHFQFRSCNETDRIKNIFGRHVAHEPKYPEQTSWSVSSLPAFIAHFHRQCWSEFCRRRSRPRDDNGSVRIYTFSLSPDECPPGFHDKDDNTISFTGLIDVSFVC